MYDAGQRLEEVFRSIINTQVNPTLNDQTQLDELLKAYRPAVDLIVRGSVMIQSALLQVQVDHPERVWRQWVYALRALVREARYVCGILKRVIHGRTLAADCQSETSTICSVSTIDTQPEDMETNETAAAGARTKRPELTKLLTNSCKRLKRYSRERRRALWR